MAVGLPLKTTYADGDVYAASDVNDTNGTINITAAPYAAGKNKIINGDFYVNQRAFTSATATGTYGFDRFLNSNSDGTVTYSAQSFTVGTAPVAGYEGKNFARIVTTGQTLTTANASLVQRIESVRILAGQTATVSFWAKANTGTPNINVSLTQNFGSGGSPSSSVVTLGTVQTITTSWARYSFTIAVPSISGKTIGTQGDFLNLTINVSGGSATNFATTGIQSNTFDFWGIQVEAGSTATAFQTATGTIQGELAACQRYYYQLGYLDIPAAYAGSTTSTTCIVRFPVQMRTAPTGITVSSTGDWRVYNQAGSFGTSTAITFNNAFTTGTLITVTTGAGSPTLTAGFGGFLYGVNPTAVIGFTGAEL